MTNKSVNEKKTIIFSVRFSPAESGRLRAAAKVNRRKLAEFISLAALDSAAKALQAAAEANNKGGWAMKGLATFSIDTEVIALFRMRFPANTRSKIIEDFIKDVTQINDPIVPIAADQYTAMIEEARKAKHTAALQLQTLEAQKAQHDKEQEKVKKEQIIAQNEMSLSIAREEKALEYIDDNGLRVDFKLSKEKLAKENKTISAVEFLAQQGISQ